MFCMNFFKFLPACRTDLDQFLGSPQITFMSVEFSPRGNVLRLRVGKLRTVDFGERLPALHVLAKFDKHTHDATGHDWRHDDGAVPIRLHNGRYAKASTAGRC